MQCLAYKRPFITTSLWSKFLFLIIIQRIVFHAEHFTINLHDPAVYDDGLLCNSIVELENLKLFNVILRKNEREKKKHFTIDFNITIAEIVWSEGKKRVLLKML